MKKFGLGFITLLLVANLLLACQPIHEVSTQPTNENSWKISCPPLPPTFKESDLIGTWVANYHEKDTDTIIIQQDGTYKQIYDDPSTGQRYESDSYKWWIERRDSGYVRLHLKGMRRCDDISLFCQRKEGGIDPELIWAIDYCEGEEVEMPDEIVLIVTGANYNTPRGIILRQTRLAGAEWTNSFSLSDNQQP